MLACRKCGVENREGAQFCSSCGFGLAEIGQQALPDNENPFGLPDFDGQYPMHYTPTRVIPRRIREKMTEGILKSLIGPFLIAVALIGAVICYLSSN